MAQFIQQPSDPWIPAGQKIILQCGEQGTVTDAYRFVVVVKENAVEIGKFYLTPNPNKSAPFDLGEVVRGRVAVDSQRYETTLPIHAQNSKMFTKSNGNINKYTVDLKTWNGSTESAVVDTHDVWLFDGHEQISAGYNPRFTDYYGYVSTNKYWLTDRVPNNNIIDVYAATEDTGVVAFINNIGTLNVSLVSQMKFNFFNADGTAYTTLNIDINSLNGGQDYFADPTTYYFGTLLYVYVYPAASTTISALLAGMTSEWSYYEVIPLDANNNQRGNMLRINNRCRPVKNEAVQLGWSNTRGGWDYLRFDGRKLKTVTREEKTYRKQIGDYNSTLFSFGAEDREITPYQVEAKETYQLNGILTSEEYDLFQYCFRSKNIMAKIGNNWVPVNLKESSLQVENDNTSKVYIATVNIELAQIIRC